MRKVPNTVVHGRDHHVTRLKPEQRDHPLKFAGFHNQSPLLTMIEGTGYEARQTSKEQTKTPRFMLEGPRPCTIFCIALIHYA